MDTRLIRHLIATIAYRAEKVIQGAPGGFPEFDAGSGVRTPREILYHISGVLMMGYRAVRPDERIDMEIGSWDDEVSRFFTCVRRLDEVVEAGEEPQRMTWEQVLQGPLADALTHVGQLATLRRMAGSPVEPESYSRADVQVGVFAR